MSLICLSQVPRPSSLPLPRTVAELMPPPCVPNDLSTPSPLRSIPNPATLFRPSSLRTLNLPQSNLKKGSGIPAPSHSDLRAGSLSPAIPGRRSNRRSTINNKNAPPEKPQIVKSVIVTNVSHNNIRGELKTCPPSVGKSLSMTIRKNSINKSATSQGQQKQLNYQISKGQPKQLNKQTSQGQQKQQNNNQTSQGQQKQLHHQTIQEQQKQLNNQTSQGQQKIKRSISLHNKKPQPLRDLNRPTGNTFYKAQGKGISGTNQPDLVKVSSSRTNEHDDKVAELQRQINISDKINYSVNQKLHRAKLDSRENAKGFEAMATVVGYLAPQALIAPELRATIVVLQKKIKAAKNATDLYESQYSNLLNYQEKQQLAEKQQLELMYERNIKLILEKNDHDMIDQSLQLVGKHEEELNGLKTKNANLEGQIKALNDSMIENADLQIQGVNKNLHKEIDSLKTVVEMRTAEVHDLRAERCRLQEKLEHFETTQENLSKSIAQVEDLREQISAKLDVERKLSEEKRVLNYSLEMESAEKKRLSMENEQLFYKIRQTIDPEDVHASDGYTVDSRTVHEGSYHLFPIAMQRRHGRPVSAPPGKDNFGFCSLPLVQDGAGAISPDSPRVLEIVEKNDSVSWKIQYMNMSDDGQSPKHPSSRQESIEIPEICNPRESSPDKNPQLVDNEVIPEVN